MSDKIMNKRQTAEYLKLSIPSVDWYMVTEGLPYYKIGKSVRFDKDRIENWLDDKNIMRKVGKALVNAISQF